ncbi:Calx-beta domain protein [Rubripirellula lacrimiformis]|uniref:Probable pectate lyase C n=1 Tax=Rubripirellula lacrimiformis TaxID=1930273 RepID=A0A517NFP5_9BACT|nr:choice-of-anchor Q domain-containing protein [Rubripirellula lacrimiformis]QDT05954.1 Calx-beta domain protein [Rubripirellula lacrimiformis]
MSLRARNSVSRQRSKRRVHRFETLENRRVLATYFVGLTTDSAVGSVCVAGDQAGAGNCNIRAAVAAAEANAGADTIQIADGNYLIDNSLGSFDFAAVDPVSLIGTSGNRDAVIIDGTSQSRGFDIFGAGVGGPAVDVTFANLTIQNAVANDSSGGGAVVSGPDVNLVFDNVRLHNNLADFESLGGPGTPSSGGAIQASGSVTIDNSLLDGNTATRDGGAIDISGFSSGGISLTIRNSTLSGNTTGDSAVDIGYGGAIRSNGDGQIDILLDRVTLTGNTAGDSGGAIAIFEDNLVAYDLTVTNNQALGSDSGGGGIYMVGDGPFGRTFEIVGGSFFGNQAVSGAGGFEAVHYPGTIDGTLFRNNSVTGVGQTFDQGGGAIALISTIPALISEVTIRNALIDQNSAAAAGGIAIVDVGVTIENSVISGNDSSDTLAGGGGIGAISTLGSTLALSIRNSNVINNTSAGSGAGVGGVDFDISITDSNLMGNEASVGRAGGVGLQGLSRIPRLDLNRVAVVSNIAGGDGGGIAVDTASLSMLNVTAAGNESAADGGGIAYNQVDDTIDSSILYSTITGNLAGGLGSNIAATGQPIAIEGSLFADGTGAAIPGIFASDGGNLDSGTSMGFSDPSDLNSTDPLLGVLDSSTFVMTIPLLAGSPAIDAATSSPIDVDARGATRPNDGNGDSIPFRDIGAFEFEEVFAFVVDVADDIDDGDVTPGNLSLREAIRLANATTARDTISFGTLFNDATPDTITLGGSELSITHSVTLVGPGQSLLTIDANLLSRVFSVSGTETEVDLSGMTLTGGRTFNTGGAISNGANLTISDSTITGNTADSLGSTGYGGGIDNSGTLTLVRSTLSNNTALNDGGAISTSGPTTIIDSVITGNNASDYAGGIAVFDSLVNVSRTTISDNVSGDSGGGLFVSGGDVSVSESTISGNTANGDGGGVYSYGNAALQLTNVTISGNRANGSGGGIRNADTGPGETSRIDVFYSTIVNNRADAGGIGSGDGGGVSIASVNSITRLTSSLVAGNVVGDIAVETASDLSGQSVDDTSDHNLIADAATSGGLIHGANGNIVGDGVGGSLAITSIFDPVLANHGGIVQTHALVSGSPAIDAGDGSDITTDARGVVRPQDGDNNGSLANDIGAYEAELTVALEVQDVTVSESAGTATVTVRLPSATGVGFTVDAATTDGTALSPSDYTSTTATLTFAGTAGETQSFTIPIINDAVNEPSESFTVSLSNVVGASVTATDTGTVQIADDDTNLPAAVADSATVIEDGTVSIGVLANDLFLITSDRIDSITQPSQGSVSINPDGISVTYVPDADYFGSDSFTYRISDRSGGFSTAIVDVSVTGDNDAPVANVDSLATPFQTTLVIASSQVIANDTTGATNELDTLVVDSASPISGTTLGTVSFDSLTGNITYFPPLGFTGLDRFRYTLSDGLATDQGVIEVNVGAAGLADLAVISTVSRSSVVIGESLTYAITVTNNGPSTALGVVMTDTLPSGVTFVSGSDSLGTALTASGGIVTANGGDLASGSSVEFTVLVTVNALAVSSITNSVSVSTTTGESDIANNSSFAVTSIDPAISGHVYCDANNSGIEESGEAQVGALVFIDLDGNRTLDLGEVSTLTDSSGDYFFAMTPAAGSFVVMDIPLSCLTIPSNPGIIRSSIDVGDLARSLQTVDIDGDGDRDLLVTGELDESLTLLVNQGGVFQMGMQTTLGNRPQSVAVFESPLLAAPAIAVAGPGTAADGGGIYRMDGMPSVAGPLTPAGNGPVEVLIDDFDSNGIPDHVVGSFRSSDLQILMNGADTPALVSAARQVRAISSGDINGDGNIDLVVGGYGYEGQADSELLVLLGDGTGEFADPIVTSVPKGLVAIEVVATTDPRFVDVDGPLSVPKIMALSNSGSLTVHQWTPSGTLERVETLTMQPGATAMAIGRFDRNEYVDVAIANLGDQTIQMYAGDGDGQFSLITTIESVIAPTAMVADDFNSDGLDELAVSNLYQVIPGVSSDPDRYVVPSTVTILRLDVSEMPVVVTTDQAMTPTDFTIATSDPLIRFDVTGEGELTAIDALRVINRLSLQDAGAAAGEQVGRQATDVNDDGMTSAVDALMIINRLNQQSARPAEGQQAESSTQYQVLDSFASVDDKDKDRIASIDEAMATLF